MSGKAEELKGRAKEAAGAAMDNDKLRREGKLEQAAGKAKQATDTVAQKVKEGIDRVTNE